MEWSTESFPSLSLSLSDKNETKYIYKTARQHPGKVQKQQAQQPVTVLENKSSTGTLQISVQ